MNGYWSDLIRSTNESAVCEEGTSERCESSLIPLNHTFVIPGGRFREQCEFFPLRIRVVGYEVWLWFSFMLWTDYWDSFWIVEGLLKSELYDIVNSTLQNFMDEIETLGFIPNGGRIYCQSFVSSQTSAGNFPNLPTFIRSQPVSTTSFHPRMFTVVIIYSV